MANPFPTIDPSDLVAYGRVRRTHGNQGEVTVTLASREWEELDPEFLFLLIDEIPVPYRVENIRGGGEQFIVALQGIDDITSAEQLVGLRVEILKDEIPADIATVELLLEGYQLSHPSAGDIGTIVSVDSTTANTLLLIERDDSSEVAIPFVEEWMVSVLPDSKSITMDFPLELLDL